MKTLVMWLSLAAVACGQATETVTVDIGNPNGPGIWSVMQGSKTIHQQFYDPAINAIMPMSEGVLVWDQETFTLGNGWGYHYEVFQANGRLGCNIALYHGKYGAPGSLKRWIHYEVAAGYTAGTHSLRKTDDTDLGFPVAWVWPQTIKVVIP